MIATLRPYVSEARVEFLSRLRLPAYALPTIGFPIMFYFFFGIASEAGKAHGSDVAAYLMASFGAFGVVGAAVFGFGAAVAFERAECWLTLKRATPMPIAAYFTAKLASAALFSALIGALLMLVATIFGHVPFASTEFAALLGILVAGAIPFCALGLAIGTLAGPNSAVPIANVINLSLSFLGGLWVPVSQLPPSIAAIAQWLPTYHFGQLALGAIGAGSGNVLVHVAALALWTLVFLGLAAYGWKRDEGKPYG